MSIHNSVLVWIGPVVQIVVAAGWVWLMLRSQKRGDHERREYVKQRLDEMVEELKAIVISQEIERLGRLERLEIATFGETYKRKPQPPRDWKN